MVNQKGVFLFHVGCCPCGGEGSCIHSFNPDAGQTIEQKFDVTGSLYGLTEGGTDYVWSSGDVNFIFKSSVPYNEQKLMVDTTLHFDYSGLDKGTLRAVVDYVDADNYHFLEIVGSGTPMDFNVTAKLGKRSGGSDNYLGSTQYDCGNAYLIPNCSVTYSKLLTPSEAIKICTGDNVIYALTDHCGLHANTVFHSGDKVGIITSNFENNAWASFADFTLHDHTDFETGTAEVRYQDAPPCIDCGSCACSGESPDSYRIYLSNLKGVPFDCYSPSPLIDPVKLIDETCCEDFYGTYIMEQWGSEFHDRYYGGDYKYCSYFNQLESNPCNNYNDAFLILTTSSTPNIPFMNRLKVSVRLYSCNEYPCDWGSSPGTFHYGIWEKYYGDPTTSGIPCSQFDYEPIPFKYSPIHYAFSTLCSGDATSCQISAL